MLQAACLGVAACCATAAHAETMSLADALATAYETNPTLSAQQANLRSVDEGVAEANANWRPSVNAQGSYGVEQFGFRTTQITNPSPPPATFSLNKLTEHPLQGELTVTQPVFRGGRTYAEIRRAKALVRSGRAQLTNTEEAVLLQAVSAYMDVVRDTVIVQLRQQNVVLLTKQRDSTSVQFKAGALTRTDVAQSEARLAGAEADLTTAKGQLATSRANFVQTIGRPPETLENEPGLPKLPMGEADVIALANKQYQLLISAQETERAASFAVDDAYGALAPTLSVQGQYFYSQGNFTSGSVGAPGGADHGVALLGLLNIPIYQGGADHAEIRQEVELDEQAKENVNAEVRQAEQAATSAWELFQSAQGTIASAKATEDADAIAFQGVSREQQVGGRTILDVLNAQQELLNAQVAVVSAQHDTVVAAYQVLSAAGTLTAKDLGLKVKLYDPTEHYDDDESRWIGFGD